MIEGTIYNALFSFGYPVSKGILNEYSDTGFSFGYFTTPAVHGDDQPNQIIYHVDVHFFAPWTFDTSEILPQISSTLYERGFTYPSITDASSQEGQHYVFDCEFAGGVPDGKF